MQLYLVDYSYEMLIFLNRHEYDLFQLRVKICELIQQTEKILIE